MQVIIDNRKDSASIPGNKRADGERQENDRCILQAEVPGAYFEDRGKQSLTLEQARHGEVKHAATSPSCYRSTACKLCIGKDKCDGKDYSKYKVRKYM